MPEQNIVTPIRRESAWQAREKPEFDYSLRDLHEHISVPNEENDAIIGKVVI